MSTAAAALRRIGPAAVPLFLGTTFAIAMLALVPGALRIAAVVALAGSLAWAVTRLRRRGGYGQRPEGVRAHPRSRWILAIASVGETVAALGCIPALIALHHPDVIPAAVALAVGLHFFPLARAFAMPAFHLPGVVVSLLGCVGMAAGWVWGAPRAAITACLAGVAIVICTGCMAGAAGRP